MNEINSTPHQLSVMDRKKNGIYYSPLEVTSILCNWAIKSSEETILEPSFGGCGFLSASRERLKKLECRRPEYNLFGCDNDPQAFEYLKNGFATAGLDRRFLLKDFLQVQPADFTVDKFDVVIGNPPYVSHHNIAAKQREEIRTTEAFNEIPLKSMPSLWAYFVLHSTKFLKHGGRFAWLLPSSFVNADYASVIRAYLRKHFLRSIVLLLEDRIFLTEGTEERTIILLCEGWSESEIEGSLEVGNVADLKSTEAVIQQWDAKTWQGVSYENRINHALLDGPALLSYSEISGSPHTKLLGDLCSIRIGIVTGANKFFVLDERKAMLESIPEQAISFVLAKFHDARGIQLTPSDLEELKRDGKRCLLVDSSCVNKIGTSLKRYLDSFPEEERLNNKTFKKRKLWHQPNDHLTPDAFFSYMQADGPSIALNIARITSTNTIHRVYFKDSISDKLRKATAISIQSTFSQLSAEIEGRSYGSGVLKHEPSEAYRIGLVLPAVSGRTVGVIFNKIDALLRQGLKSKAQALADDFVFANYSHKAKQHHLAVLSQALKDARSRRRRPSKLD